VTWTLIASYRGVSCKKLNFHEHKYYELDFIFFSFKKHQILIGKIVHLNVCLSLSFFCDLYSLICCSMVKLWHYQIQRRGKLHTSYILHQLKGGDVVHVVREIFSMQEAHITLKGCFWDVLLFYWWRCPN